MIKKYYVFMPVLLLITTVTAAFLLSSCKKEDWTADSAVELRLRGYFAQDSWQTYWTGAISRFEENTPGIKIKYIRPERSFIRPVKNTLKMIFNSTDAPDLLALPILTVAAGAENGWFEPLDKYINKWDDRTDIIDFSLDQGMYKGKRYGIGYRPNSFLFLYRKDFFREAGLNPDHSPDTWEELADYSEKLTIREGNMIIRGGLNIPSDDFFFLATFARQNGGDFLTKEGQPAFDSIEWVEALDYLADLTRNRKVNILTDLADFRKNNFLVQGKAAISMMRPSHLKKLLKKTSNIKNIGIMNLKRKRAAVWAGCFFLFINSESRHKDAAWEFNKFILSPDETWQRYKETGIPVVRHSLREKYLKDDSFINGAIWESIKVGYGAARVEWFEDMSREIRKAMLETFHEEKPAALALKEARERLLKKISSDE